MSDLQPYLVNDFAWDSIQDQFERTDGTTIRPRNTKVALSAKQRFTKFDPNPHIVKVRLDISNAPQTYVSATQARPERQTTLDPAPRTERTARQVSDTLHHYDTGWAQKKL
jgi:hypothetical protein